MPTYARHLAIAHESKTTELSTFSNDRELSEEAQIMSVHVRDGNANKMDTRHAVKEAHYVATVWRDATTLLGERRKAQRVMKRLERIIEALS